MFDNTTHIGLIDFNRASIILGAGPEVVNVHVQFAGSKSDGSGMDTTVALADQGIHTVEAFSSARVMVNANHPSFTDGYGHILLRSVAPDGSASGTPYYAYASMRPPRSAHPVSGASHRGLKFHLPLVDAPANNPVQRVRLAITAANAASPTTTVNINAPGPSGGGQFTIKSNHTMLWDSDDLAGVDVTKAGVVQVEGNNNLSVAAVVYRAGNRFGHIYPTVLTSV